MAKPPAPETAPRKRRGQSVFVYILMAMLVAGLGGFGLTNFGGGQASIGQVGGRDIEMNDYARTLRQEMQAFSAQVGTEVSFEQAQSLGLDKNVVRQLVATAAMDNETDRVGLSVGDARVAQEIMGMDAFQGAAGSFDREAYRFTLERNNMTEVGFETKVREDLARALLQGAVSGGFTAPAPMLDAIQSWLGERRGFSVLKLTEADLATPVADPTDADLQAFYDANAPLFTAPEAKRITYAALLPDMLTDEVQLDEEALRAAYQERIDEFVQPERRLVERLVYPTEAEAAAAKARIDAGEPFETLVAERGLALTDVDLGEQSQADLGAAGDAVFALLEPGVVGPLPSDLGPALFRMNGILVAQETSFEDARETLAAEQSNDAARRLIADKIEAIDDLLAGGATLEELVEDAGMQLGTVDFAPGVDAPILGYEDFRKAAEAVKDGDFPEVIQLEDGGIVALRLDEVVPPALRPFAEVKDDAATAWRAEAVTKALRARADEAMAAIANGSSLGAFGIVSVTQSATRDAFVEGAPEGTVATAFQMTEAEVRLVEGPDFVGLMQLDAITPAPKTGDEAEAIRAALSAQVAQSISQDAFQLFSTGLVAETGVTLNDAAINAVNAQMQ